MQARRQWVRPWSMESWVQSHWVEDRDMARSSNWRQGGGNLSGLVRELSLVKVSRKSRSRMRDTWSRGCIFMRMTQRLSIGHHWKAIMWLRFRLVKRIVEEYRDRGQGSLVLEWALREMRWGQGWQREGGITTRAKLITVLQFVWEGNFQKGKLWNVKRLLNVYPLKHLEWFHHYDLFSNLWWVVMEPPWNTMVSLSPFL